MAFYYSPLSLVEGEGVVILFLHWLFYLYTVHLVWSILSFVFYYNAASFVSTLFLHFLWTRLEELGRRKGRRTSFSKAALKRLLASTERCSKLFYFSVPHKKPLLLKPQHRLQKNHSFQRQSASHARAGYKLRRRLHVLRLAVREWTVHKRRKETRKCWRKMS